jgi:hypothetical protein
MASKPGRFDSGVQMATGTASWQGATGVGGLYYKTAVGLVMRKTDNTEVTLGAGGGSGTLATTYSGGASTADSTISLDSTRGKILIKDNATPIGILFEIQASAGTSKFSFDASNMNFGVNRGITTSAGIGAFDFSNATGVFSTSSGNNTLSGNVSLASGKTFVYAGGASTFDASLSSGVFKTTTGAHTFGSASWAVPANLVVTGSASSTNTVGMAHTSNVADGATSVAHSFDNTAAFSTDGATVFRVRTAGSDIFTIARSSSARKFTFFGDADASGNGPLLVKSTSSSAGVTLDATTAGGRIYQMYSTSAGIFNLADITAGLNRWQMDSTAAWSPVADNSYDIGIAATNRVRSIYYMRTGIPVQTVAAATSTTINPASGDHVRLTLSATAITTMTISAGQDGELLTVQVIEDATGTRTIPTTWTNVQFAGGTYTATTTANKRDVLTFRYDSTAAKWMEQSRAMNV